MQSHKISNCLETSSQNNFVLFNSMPSIIHTLTQACKEFNSLFDIHKPINVAILYFYAGRQFSPKTLCFFNKQQTLILLREKGYKYTFVNQADYTNIFALQLAPMLLVHLAGSFVIALCPNSFDYHFWKYMGNCNYFKNNNNVLRQVLQILFFFFQLILMEPIFIRMQISFHSTPVI